MQVAKTQVHAVEPKVRLVAWTHDPHDLAVASARTCYAADFVYLRQLTPKGERSRTNLRDALPDHVEALDEIGDPRTPAERRIALVAALKTDADEDTAAALDVFALMATERRQNDARIAASIYEAGHHTPFQHPTFVFALEDVSRNVVESFFHQHTFYNSEQQSQRYVEMKRADVHVPASIAAHGAARQVYDDAVSAAWDAYHALRRDLVDANIKTMRAIGKIKGQSEKAIEKEAEKKSQEMARYVIPIAAGTRLYHTVSGIVLMRYLRMARASNAADEAQAVIEAMMDAVRDVDPEFVERLAQDPVPDEGLLESRPVVGAKASWDSEHGHAELLHATAEGEALVAQAIQDVTGSPADLDAVLDPGANRLWNDTLNTWDHSPVLRSLRHVHYTFRKRISLTAFAQDQRHRMTPATRPLLETLITPAPDVYTPDIVGASEATQATYDGAVATLWSAMHELLELGIPARDVAYLLPNATNQVFLQSGDLLSFIHKWRLRLCFNAQKEIFDASLEELRQVQAVHPELTRWLGPPCTFVAAAQPAEMQDDVEACCPEGPRWCGVKVWKNFDAAKGKPKRPY